MRVVAAWVIFVLSVHQSADGDEIRLINDSDVVIRAAVRSAAHPMSREFQTKVAAKSQSSLPMRQGDPMDIWLYCGPHVLSISGWSPQAWVRQPQYQNRVLTASFKYQGYFVAAKDRFGNTQSSFVRGEQIAVPFPVRASNGVLTIDLTDLSILHDGLKLSGESR